MIIVQLATLPFTDRAKHTVQTHPTCLIVTYTQKSYVIWQFARVVYIFLRYICKIWAHPLPERVELRPGRVAECLINNHIHHQISMHSFSSAVRILVKCWEKTHFIAGTDSLDGTRCIFVGLSVL